MRVQLLLTLLLTLCAIGTAAQEQSSPTGARARGIGIPFDGNPGKLNAITDVPGVEVGMTTIIRGNGTQVVGTGPVRTGVTVVLPKGKTDSPYPAAWFSLNGDGELTGTTVIEDYGTGYGPIGITNTNSVGIVRDAIGEWAVRRFSNRQRVDFSFGLPVVGETWDGNLNDINGYHVKKEHVFEALDSATSGAVPEGNVGGGTGMWLYGFKGGTGTASRVFTIDSVEYTVGVLVQANFGRREDLTVAGVPVGKEITDLLPILREPQEKDGSVIVIVGTDAPLLPNELKLVAKRVAIGIGRTGTYSSDGSGDIFLAFSTATPVHNSSETRETWSVLPKSLLNPVFKGTVEATEEAIINVLVAAETMEGINGNMIFAIPHERLMTVMKQYNRAK
jgi:L-aminopeptidase/D-esterase-like protein